MQLGKSIEQNRASTSKETAAFAEVKAAHDAGVAELAKAEELLQSLITGLSSGNGDDDNAGGYMGQLAEAKARVSAAGTEIEQAKVKITAAEKEIKEKEPKAKKAEKEGESLLKELREKKAEVEKLQKKLEGGSWDEGREADLLQRQADQSGTMADLLEVSVARVSLTLAPRCFEIPSRCHRLFVL